MQDTAEGRPSHPTAVGRRGVRAARALAAGAGLFLLVTAVGGYGFRWKWTGFAENDTLWDWLQLVLLPVTLTCLPLWTVTKTAHRTVWRGVTWALAGLLVVLVVGGYAVPWRWTGFVGNTLWDWLQLFLVPFVLPLVVGWMTAHLPSHRPEERS